MSDMSAAPNAPEKGADLPYRPCVGVMVINQDGLIFAGQRIDNGPSDAPAWQMPQGGIDEGEAPEAAALRELWEETGLDPARVEILGVTANWVTYDLPDDLIGKVWGGKYRGQKQKWFLMRFTGDDGEINIATEHPEFCAWRWIDAAAMIDAIVPFKRQVYQEVVAEFRDHLA